MLRVDAGEKRTAEPAERSDRTSLLALCDALAAGGRFTYLHVGSDPHSVVELLESNPACERVIRASTPDAVDPRHVADICFISADEGDSALDLARRALRALSDRGILVFADRTRCKSDIRRFLSELPRPRVYPLTYDLLVVEVGTVSLLGEASVSEHIPRPIWRALARAGVLRHALVLAPTARRLELSLWRALFPHITPKRRQSSRVAHTSCPAIKSPFSIQTFVTDEAHYERMQASFADAGFDQAFVRLSDHDDDPYRAIGRFGETPSARYSILCHQDVRADRGAGAADLLQMLEQLDAIDPAWVVAGTAGVKPNGRHVRSLVDPAGGPTDDPLPAGVMSLDENFLVFNVRNKPRSSPGLSGFHLYGTDACLNAVVCDCSAYVIAFPITHLSSGRRGREYEVARASFIETWSSAFVFCFVVTQTGAMFLSRWKLLRWIFGSSGVLGYVERACTDPNVSATMLPAVSEDD